MLPRVNETSATELFRTMRAAKVGKELRTVEFVVGDYYKPEGGGLRIEEPKDIPQRWQCRIGDAGEQCYGPYG